MKFFDPMGILKNNEKKGFCHPFFSLFLSISIGSIFWIFLSAPLALAAENPARARLDSILQISSQSYDSVKDYRALFYKQEDDHGKLGTREKIFLKFEKPFKIFMHWLDTHKQGLQVLYERGRHNGKLAIHKPGLLLGLAPVVFLDQSSPWVKEGSESYNIEDAGIGTFLSDFKAMVEKASGEGKILSKISEDESGQTVDVTFPGTSSGESGYFAYRVVVLFDASNHLPVRMSLYDWNEKLTGIYEYTDLALNVGAEDPEFKKLAQRQLYKLYLPPETKPVVKKKPKVSRPSNEQSQRTLGPVSDLERHLPPEWWKTLFNSLYLKTD